MGWGLGPRDERFLRSPLERKAPGLSVLRLPKCLCRRSAEGKWNRTTYAIKSRLIERFSGRTPGSIVWYH